jgi:protein transport protein SEC31
MSAIVNRDWTQLVRVCNLDNWREILAALVTYASPDEFSTLCDLLGDRLEGEGEGRYRDNANLCYICSGNVDKFVECWNTTANSSPVSAVALQDLMEKVILLQRAVERERTHFSSASSVVAEKFRAYSDVLASQGSLTTALNYLEMSGTSETNALLHDRLYQAQGGKPSGPNPKHPFQVIDVQPQRVALEPEQQTSVQQQSQVQPVSGLHAVPNTATATTAVVPNPYQQTLQGNHQQSQPTSYTPYNPTSQTSQTSIPSSNPQTHNALGGGASTSTTMSHVNQSGQPVSIFNPVAPVPGTGFTSGPSTLSQVAPPPSRIPGPSPAAFSQVSAPLPSWNDPPTLTAKKKTSVTSPMPQPITAPVMTPVSVPVAQQQAPPTSGVGMTQHQSSVVAQPPPHQVVEKPPIPAEHQQMVSAFEALLSNCRIAASTTALKRKTEDISKKLAILCDLLRDSRISPDVLMGLHYIAQEASSFNYSAGLARYTQMVSSGNFSEISSFMPGIKAMLQMAIQLQMMPPT